MVVDLSEQHSILNEWIAELRDVQVQQDRMRFRRNLERIGSIAAYEISKRLAYREQAVTTPLGSARCQLLEEQPVLGTILRAGIPLHNGVMQVFDKASHAFIGAYRKHRPDGSFDISLDYLSCPPLDGRILILSDPMLATGASLVKTLQELLRQGRPASIHVIAAMASRPGIALVLTHFPDISIWAGVIDSVLNDKGYIVPGLGDAGDLAFGDKMQE